MEVHWDADCAMQRFNILEPINYNDTFFWFLSHGMGYVGINYMYCHFEVRSSRPELS